MLRRAIKNLRRAFRSTQDDLDITKKDQEYLVGRILVRLPYDHALPGYQKSYRLYDKVLPFFVPRIEPDCLIVDIGANCGDTCLLLCQYARNPIYAVEPDPFFYDYLVRNVNNSGLAERVKTENVAIGKPGERILLESVRGTAKPVLTEVERGISTLDLSSVLAQSALSNVRVGLLKVDTDGFDFRILSQSMDLIRRDMPMLYWENTVETQEQLVEASSLYKSLKEAGYSHFVCFDNFGTLMLLGSDFGKLQDINEWLFFQARARQRAVFYTDVLAISGKDLSGVELGISEYRNFAESHDIWPPYR